MNSVGWQPRMVTLDLIKPWMETEKKDAFVVKLREFGSGTYSNEVFTVYGTERLNYEMEKKVLLFAATTDSINQKDVCSVEILWHIQATKILKNFEYKILIFNGSSGGAY